MQGGGSASELGALAVPEPLAAAGLLRELDRRGTAGSGRLSAPGLRESDDDPRVPEASLSSQLSLKFIASANGRDAAASAGGPTAAISA